MQHNTHSGSTPSSARQTVTACPVCGSESMTTLFHKNDFPICQCPECRFLTVGAYPTPQEIAKHYAENYRGATAEYYPKDRSRRWRAFWRAARLAPWTLGKDVIDIGCGGGHMAQALSRFSRSVCGVDISENSLAFALEHFRKPKFHLMSLETLAQSGMTFDFVFSSEVLEHLPGPHAFMTALAAITRPSGIVHITAPEYDHACTPPDISTWQDICPPEHLQWFSEENLRLLFEQYGFRQILKEKTGSPAHSVFFQKTKHV